MSINQQLLEAVNKYNQTEKDFLEARTRLSDLLKQAALTQKITNLARVTGINRTTIYWLIRTWSSKNENGSSRYNSRTG